MAICTRLPYQKSLKVCQTGLYQEVFLGGGSLYQWHEWWYDLKFSSIDPTINS